MSRISGSCLLIALSLSAAASGCSSNSSPTTPSATPTPTPPTLTFPIQASYGTLHFNGTFARVEYATSYEYIFQLTATFNANARTNHVPTIHLGGMTLDAGQLDPTVWKTQVLYEQFQSISADFTVDGDVRQLPQAAFWLDKATEAQANHVTLTVVGGGTMWPIPVELKVPCPATWGTVWPCPPGRQ